MSIDTVLFDMDGVLVDSRPCMELAWIKVCQQFGLCIPFENYLSHVGKPFEVILSILGVDTCIHAEVKYLYGSCSSINSHKIKPYKNISYVLKLLLNNDLKIGIVTSKEFWRAELICDSFLLPAQLLVTPEHTIEGKPSPQPIFYAMNKLRSQPEDTIYIGDMQSDLESASSAKVSFAYASWGYGNVINSKINFDNPVELLEYLNYA